MENISKTVGTRVRRFRKERGMTAQQLAEAIHKSKATISKYESGEIALDVPTLYEIAAVLHLHADELLPREGAEPPIVNHAENIPYLFRDATQFYAYYFDGRNGQLIRCVMDVLSQEDDGRFRIAFYMNYKDYEQYQVCEHIYYGYMEHFDVLTNIYGDSRDTPIEKISIKILGSFQDVQYKWGLWSGVSSRPIMPVALKMLFSKKRLKEDRELVSHLKISKEDVRLMKTYNMFCTM